MTTSPVMTVTDELLAELEYLAASVKGWNMPSAFAQEEEDLLQEEWEWHVGQIDEDGNLYPVMTINAQQYDSGDSELLARYYAACNRDTILSMTQELRRLRAENAELAQSLAESRANDQAAMGWLTSLRSASGDRGERMLPELVTHIEGLAKDAGRYRWLRIASAGNESAEPHGLCVELWDTGSGYEISGADLDTAIETAMATQ